MLTAALACLPLSPKSVDKVSEAGFITFGWSLKSSVELTKPVILIQFLTLSISPLRAFLTWANIFITQSFEALWPSSNVKSLPIFPLIIFPSFDIGSCPEINNRLPTFLKATYDPTGSGALGNSIFSFLRFSDKTIFFFFWI